MSRLRDNPRDNLVEYALGTLTPAEQAEVEAYLTDSEDARAELRELRASLVALTEALPAAEPRAAVWGEYSGAARGREPKYSSRSSRCRPRGDGLPSAWVAWA